MGERNIIELTSPNVIMSEEGISWESDRKARFKQPSGLTYYKECDAGTSCSDCFGARGSEFDDCEDYTDPATGTEFKYWYRDNAKTQRLYETYPEVVSPFEGVLNEHFIVWMRTAGLYRGSARYTARSRRR
ncbi:unnamed protein product [Pylaiella littoralis]